MQEQLLQLISLGTIFVLVFNLLFIILEIFKLKNPFKTIVLKYQMLLIAIVSSGAVLGSVLLSIYFKLAPCELCWYQRVFMFALPVIAFVGIYRKDLSARTYVFVLSCIGFIVALYHSFIQLNIFKSDSVFCNPAAAVDCSVPAFVYYGFVTVPIMSLSIFTLLLILSYAYSRE